MHTTVRDRIKSHIKRSRKDVFFRNDFEEVATYRHVSRVLSELEKQNLIVHAGYGIYTKPIPPERREAVLAEIKTKLGRRVNRLVEVGGITYHIGKNEAPKRNAQSELDQFKLLRAETVLRLVDMPTIRKKSLANLERWKAKNTWCSAYDEWREIMTSGTDEQIIAVMTGRNEDANRLRQSAPYVGLLDQKTVEELRETVRT